MTDFLGAIIKEMGALPYTRAQLRDILLRGRGRQGEPLSDVPNGKGLNAPPARAVIDGKVGVDINLRGDRGATVAATGEGAVGSVKVRRGAMMPKPSDRD